MTSPDKILLKLYVIKKSPGTQELVHNLKLFLDNGLRKEYMLEIIDILSNPETAIQDKILASPTLIKTEPYPPKRIVGKLAFSKLLEELEISD